MTPGNVDFWNGPRIVYPASAGARNWYPAAYDPTRKLYFAHVLDMGNLMFGPPPGTPEQARRARALNVQTTLIFTPMLQQVANRIPVLPNGDSIILVETFLDYQPIMPIGLNQTVLQTFITTAPRFSSCVPWQDYGCGTDNQGRWVRPDLTDVPDPDTDLGDTT